MRSRLESIYTTWRWNETDILEQGSLARAGKVKAATPKVDKQEKVWYRAHFLFRKNNMTNNMEQPKQPKGRARKRLVYTRRFVNVTLTGGKRKVRNFKA